MDRFAARVAERATSITPIRILLAILVAPFWLVGVVAAILWLVVSWAIAAVQEGFSDVQRKAKPDREKPPGGDT